jgi:hypothetical protein
MSAIEPGQVWRDKITGRTIWVQSAAGEHDGLWMVSEADTVAGRDTSVVEVLTEERILGEYELDEAGAAVDAGGEQVGPSEVEGPNSA